MALNMIKNFSFRPTLWPTVATLIFLPLFISLGLWQWHRAEYKQHLMDHYSAKSAQTGLSLERALLDPEGFRYYRLKLQGHYMAQRQFLQENQFNEHRLGYYVLTPFLADSGQLILINRGWVPREFNQKDLNLNSSPLALEGRVSVAPSRTFHLGKNLKNSDAWPRQIQVIKIDELSSALGQKIEPLIVLLNPDEPAGFARNWQPQGLPPEKHRGYALQWFAFAALLAILFLSLNLKRKTR